MCFLARFDNWLTPAGCCFCLSVTIILMCCYCFSFSGCMIVLGCWMGGSVTIVWERMLRDAEDGEDDCRLGLDTR